MIKDALIKKLEGDIEVAKADLRTFLDKPHAEDKLESLLKL
mgnify:CR=1 FL=1